MIDELAWWQQTIVYECYPRSFQDWDGTTLGSSGVGTLKGITHRLDYLAKLGVGAIWLTPVYDSPQRDNGYDVANYKAIWPQLGTMEDMDELILEAGRRGIKIVMDLVFNHTSDENPWFVESRSSPDNPRADWYIWRDGKVAGTPEDGGMPPNNWGSIFGGPAWTYDRGRQQWYLHTFGSFQPDLNWENPEVRHALYDIANFWADKGVGGFRIDAVTYIKKPAGLPDGTHPDATGLSPVHEATANTPGILDYLHEFRREVCDGRDIFCVGEANGVTSGELGQWVGKDGVFDMLFEFNVMHVPMDAGERWYVPKDWKLTDVKRAIAASQRATAEDGWYPVFWENHDQPRSVSNFFPPEVDHTLAAQVLATVLLTMRGTPFIYQGEELGYCNVAWDSIDAYEDVSSKGQYAEALANGRSEEEALACVQRYSRDNARTPMQWDESPNAGFTAGRPWLPVHPDFARRNARRERYDGHSVLRWYWQLIELRRSRQELIGGDWQQFLEDSEDVFCFRRVLGSHATTVLVNWSDHEVHYDPLLVMGQVFLLGNRGASWVRRGTLLPLEATVWGTRR